MPNRLASAISPYLRSHADNPVDWQAWGEEAFAEARARDVPVLVSIGYSTCHWCHVMARESFSDPNLAAYLNAHFVSVKVDREEHPDVDATYLAAASAFVDGLGWPLNVFVTPDGKAFHAGTYFPPEPRVGHPSFRQVLDAVTDAWTSRRAGVIDRADAVAEALTTGSAGETPAGGLPDRAALSRAVAVLAAQEDSVYGGFGSAPKFPVAPVLGFLLDRLDGRELALRTLKRLGASPLRDPIEGGFFRYTVNRDWSEPHYERMLYDNAQLLDLYTRAWTLTGDSWASRVAEGIARFLGEVLALPDGGFASAQDSESIVDGERVEGGYYALDEDARGRQRAPGLDEKVLTGWNGLAIAALARAGFAFDDVGLTALATRAADHLLIRHRRGDTGLVRASLSTRTSDARATLEDYGMLAQGLIELALTTGESRYAVAGRDLIDATLAGAGAAADSEPGGAAGADSEPGPALAAAADPGVTAPFRVPNGGDPVLAGQGLGIPADRSEGAYPSGLTAVAGAARLLYLLTADARYRTAAEAAMLSFGGYLAARPLAFGAALSLASALIVPVTQLVVVLPDAAAPVADLGRLAMLNAARRQASSLVVVVTETQARAFADVGFELFQGRPAADGLATAYLCRDFVCRLPVTDPSALPDEIDSGAPPRPGP